MFWVRHETRHGIFPMTIRKLSLSGAIGTHDPDRAVGLEGVIVERRFVFESVLTTVPHDVLAIRRPDGMRIIRGEGRQPT